MKPRTLLKNRILQWIPLRYRFVCFSSVNIIVCIDLKREKATLIKNRPSTLLYYAPKTKFLIILLLIIQLEINICIKT